MKIITVASPDKISLNMFINFLMGVLGGGYTVGNMHSLMSEEAVNLYVDGFINRNEKSILCYYAKKKANVSPHKTIPKKLIEVSDVVIWFNLYATDYELVKDNEQFSEKFLDLWKKNVERLNLIQTDGSLS